MALVAQVAGYRRAKPEDFIPGKRPNRIKLTLEEFGNLVSRNTP